MTNKQTVLGIGWAILVPTPSMVVLTIDFTPIAPLEADVPYPIYAYSGLLPWTFFAASLRATTTSLASNPQLVTKRTAFGAVGLAPSMRLRSDG